MPADQLIDVVLLAMLAVTAIAIARLRNLLATAMLLGIFSLLGASWMLLLDAPDVAFTEAAVGAGISTILVLATLAVTSIEVKKPASGPSLLALAVVVVTGSVLVYGTLDMPRYGDPDSPANRSPITRVYLYSANAAAEHGDDPPPAGEQPGHAAAVPDAHGAHPDPDDLSRFAVGIPNTVTTVLASFRGYDTMGEAAVIFTAGLGVVAILSGARRRRFRASEPPPGDEARS